MKVFFFYQEKLLLFVSIVSIEVDSHDLYFREIIYMKCIAAWKILHKWSYLSSRGLQLFSCFFAKKNNILWEFYEIYTETDFCNNDFLVA